MMPALSNPAAVSPYFTPTLAGAYIWSLVVNDGTVNSVSDNVTVNVADFGVAAAGGIATIAGSIDLTDPSFTRMFQDCASQATGSYYYDPFIIANTTGSSQTVDIQAAWSADGYLFVYNPTFNPAAPATACQLGDDDSPWTTDFSIISGVTIPAGDYTWGEGFVGMSWGGHRRISGGLQFWPSQLFTKENI